MVVFDCKTRPQSYTAFFLRDTFREITLSSQTDAEVHVRLWRSTPSSG